MLKPSPAIPCLNMLYRRAAGSSNRHDVDVSNAIGYEPLYLHCVLFRYLSQRAPFPSIMCVMDNLVGMVLRTCFPRKMFWVDTSKVAIPARMRGVVIGVWRLPMNNSTRLSRDDYSFSAKPYSPVPCAVSTKGPNEAGIFRAFKDIVKKEVLGGLSVVSASNRVFVFFPPNPMLVAPSSSFNRKAASIYRACFHRVLFCGKSPA